MLLGGIYVLIVKYPYVCREHYICVLVLEIQLCSHSILPSLYSIAVGTGSTCVVRPEMVQYQDFWSDLCKCKGRYSAAPYMN